MRAAGSARPSADFVPRPRQVQRHALVRRDEAQAFVEADRVGAQFVRGQLHPVAAALPCTVDRVEGLELASGKRVVREPPDDRGDVVSDGGSEVDVLGFGHGARSLSDVCLPERVALPAAPCTLRIGRAILPHLRAAGTTRGAPE